MTGMTVGFAGMTHLGLNSAVASADLGATVVGYDPDPAHVANLQALRPHVLEPDLDRLMGEHRDRLRFTHEVADLAACPVVVVAPDVPTDDQGQSDLAGLEALIAAVDDALPPEAVLVLLSQVPPGFTRALRLKACRRLFYQVETLIFGEAIERARHPERFIVGCADPTEPLPEPYRTYLEAFACPILPMRYESAELAKISINCCLVASVSVANTLAELCEHLGAEWSEIVPALKKDRRIGPYAYLAPGLGISGGNLERDLNTVVRLADRHGTDAGVVRAWLHNSAYRKAWALRALHRHVFPQVASPRLAVWGLAYKQDTHSTKNSPAVELIRHLPPGLVRAYDPAVRGSSLPDLGLSDQDSALAVCEGADALVVMTPWRVFSEVPLCDILSRMRGRVLIDPYGLLPRAVPQGERVLHLVLGSRTEA
jgi:UDPglucose 6-dehydrogenase